MILSIDNYLFLPENSRFGSPNLPPGITAALMVLV